MRPGTGRLPLRETWVRGAKVTAAARTGSRRPGGLVTSDGPASCFLDWLSRFGAEPLDHFLPATTSVGLLLPTQSAESLISTVHTTKSNLDKAP
jgi:hypothetical protein